MNSFTKGPWFVDGLIVYALQECTWLGIPSMENRFFTNIQGPKCDDDELIANANLISAAPDMYKALKAIHLALINDELTPGHQNEALKALAKADGKGG